MLTIHYHVFIDAFMFFYLNSPHVMQGLNMLKNLNTTFLVPFYTGSWFETTPPPPVKS